MGNQGLAYSNLDLDNVYYKQSGLPTCWQTTRSILAVFSLLFICYIFAKTLQLYDIVLVVFNSENYQNSEFST